MRDVALDWFEIRPPATLQSSASPEGERLQLDNLILNLVDDTAHLLQIESLEYRSQPRHRDHACENLLDSYAQRQVW